MIRHLSNQEINTLYTFFKQQDEKKLAERPDYCGIPGIKFIFHNTWADPTLIYKGEEFNVHDVEDTLWGWFCDDGYGDADEDYFGDYVFEHKDEVYWLLDEILESRKKKRKENNK